MHDLSALESDETPIEQELMEWEDEEAEDTEFEYEFEAESEGEYEYEQEDEDEINEAEELESAAELLAVGSEAELDHFLGGLIKKAATSLGKVVKATTGKSLGGLLKGVAKRALPMVATAIGGPVGGLLAKGGLDLATKAFKLELEGLSEEDQELELARRYVRFANATARRAVRQTPSRDPRAQARSAVRWGLRRYAPGLLGGNFRRRRQSRGAGYPAYAPAYLQQPPATVALGAPAECPVCPACGASTPSSTDADAADGAANGAPGGESSEFEYEFEGESEESDRERRAPVASGSAGGTWVRRGNRIILYGV